MNLVFDSKEFSEKKNRWTMNQFNRIYSTTNQHGFPH